MWATPDGPRIQDFGVTEDDLSRVPKLFLASHRAGVFLAAYLLAAAAIFALIYRTSDSLPAAAFFTVVTLAAGSVLLLPFLVLLLCAGERAEERWLCRRVPMLRACLAYQRAVAEHDREADKRLFGPPDPKTWFGFSYSTFRNVLQEDLERRCGSAVSSLDREATGADFLVDLGETSLLLRCEAGLEPVAAAVGRELAAAVGDCGARAAIIVTVAEPTPALDDYIESRPISIAAPWALEAVLSGTGRR